jgi:nucleotide-binding universal stress UspA family protein
MWTPKNIVFLFNPSVNNQQALKQVLSTVANNQARLTIISVFDPPMVSDQITSDFALIPESEKNIIEAHQRALNDTELDYGELDISHRILVGESHIETIREVIREGYDLLVKASDNQGRLDRIFGREDMRLLRKCPCPVWLIQPKGLQSVEAHQKTIMAAIDVSDMYKVEELAVRHELSLKVLEAAYSLAIAESAELHVVSVWSAPYESSMRVGFNKQSEEKVNDYVANLEQGFLKNFETLMHECVQRVGSDAEKYLIPKTALIKGVAEKAIAQHASDVNANVVVMGTVARTGIAGLIIGNTAESILDQLDQSVVAIKPPGFVSPVQL